MRALAGVDLDDRARRVHRHHGPFGLGQVHRHEHHRLPRPADRRQLPFRGVEVDGLTRDQRALLRRNFIGFVFQGFNLLTRTTAIENVELPLIYRGMPQARAARDGDARRCTVGLAGREHHTPGELSGGQQQRVAIARAIVTDPLLLLADEPTGNLDTARSREIMELIAGLNAERGITVVMVTHEADMAAYAHRIIRFVDGRHRQRRGRRRPPDAVGSRQARAVVDPAQRAALGADAARHRHRRRRGDRHGDDGQRAPRSKVRENLAKLGTNMLIVRPGQSTFGPGGATDSRAFDERDVAALKAKLSGIRGVAPTAQKQAKAVFGALNYDTSVTGTNAD